MSEEQWVNILEFPIYDVSNLGNIYNNRHDHFMSVSKTSHGHTKITLTNYDGTRHTRSVALLVAEAFVEPPNILCDQVIVLDGNFENVAASNLAWRPRWFAWKYARQLKQEPPRHYLNLPVLNTLFNIEYESVVQAGIAEGLLFEEIWRSTYQGTPTYPHGIIFEIL